jgi:protein-tyrosine phosphatase
VAVVLFASLTRRPHFHLCFRYVGLGGKKPRWPAGILPGLTKNAARRQIAGMTDQPLNLLVVCLGNICRSPMAQGALEHLAAAHGLNWRIDSAGTGGWHAGDPPDPRAIKAASRVGIDISNQRARQVQPQDFYEFDVILAMDQRNLADLAALRPADARAALHLFLELAGLGRIDVPDPYYGTERGFADCLKLVQQGAQGAADAILASG